MKNRLADLYNHLFETIETLKETKPVALETEIKRATAVRMTADTLVEAAKLELSMRKMERNLPQSPFFASTEPMQVPAPKNALLEDGNSLKKSNQK
jgi:hypothetical protein